MGRNGIDVERHLRTIFRRCVKCPPGAPSCPVCPSDETCSLIAESCTECASTTCVKITTLPGQAAPQSNTPVGAIAGAVVGGVAAICVLTYLIYRSCIKRRRKEDQAWMDQKVEKRDQSNLAHRQSTRSVHSIASTVLTRASNVIQIAYIPGVTNRTPPDSPAHLIPPVPALPFGSANTSAASTPHLEQDMHFFMPSDLRDSTYSNMTEDQRISIAPSLARASVATTIYRNHAVVSPLPAQQAFVSRPAVVSVKSGSTTPSSHISQQSTAPPVPQIPASIENGNRKIIGRNLTPKPIEVRKASSGTKVPTLGNLARAASASKKNASPGASPQIWDEKEVVVSRGGGEPSSDSPVIRPQRSYASFQSDNSSSISAVSPLRNTESQSAALNIDALIEDAMRSAARDPTHKGLGSRPELRSQDSGPFSDSHELQENQL